MGNIIGENVLSLENLEKQKGKKIESKNKSIQVGNEQKKNKVSYIFIKLRSLTHHNIAQDNKNVRLGKDPKRRAGPSFCHCMTSAICDRYSFLHWC